MKSKILIIGSMLLVAGCATSRTYRSIPEGLVIPEVSVLITQSDQIFSISGTAAFAIKTVDQEDVTFVSAGQVIQLRENEKRVEVLDGKGKSLGAYDKLNFISKDKMNRFKVVGNSYRGSLSVSIVDGKVTVINQLDMESYLMGVVRNEIGTLPQEQLEAAKAQAVAARTYAVKNKGKYKTYDLNSDVSDQVYQGAGTESDVTNQAVIETLGQVAQYDGKPIDALYFSTAGGYTSNSEWVWKTSVPYLRGVSTKAGGKFFDSESPHFRWKIEWAGEDIERTIKNNMASVLKDKYPQEDFSKLKDQRLFNLSVIKRDSSYRVQEFKVGFAKDSYTMNGEQARRLLKGEKYILYSSMFKFDISRNPDGTLLKVVCQGAGFGHGVGMCQYSAREMAKEGYSFNQILQFFYRGTSLKKLY